MLKEVTVKAHKVYHREKPDLSNSANLNGPGQANQVITAAQLKGCLNLADCLNELILNHISPAEMTLIIDGVIIRGTSGIKLNDLDANNIHSIEVLTSQSYLGIYGGAAGAAALVITTKRGGKDYINTATAPGTHSYTFTGFYKAHEFYSPKYNTPQNNALASDLRATIYWDPNIITGADGKTTLNYYNGGIKGTYRVVMEGINDEGNLGRLVYRYKVE
jgi:hypothetical protein